MKTYEKPMLTVLSLSGNDQLCGTCADNNGTVLNDNETVAKEIMEFYDIVDKTNNGPSADDFANLFGADENCARHDPPIYGYCKFTSNTNLVAWS